MVEVLRAVVAGELTPFRVTHEPNVNSAVGDEACRTMPVSTDTNAICARNGAVLN